RVDVVVLRALGERVVERVEGVVGRLLLRLEQEEVRLGVGHAVDAAESLHQRVGGLSGAWAHDDEPAAANGAEAAPDPAVRRREDALLALLRHALLEAHEDAPGSGRTLSARGSREHQRGRTGGDERPPQRHRAAPSSSAITAITAWIRDRCVNA